MTNEMTQSLRLLFDSEPSPRVTPTFEWALDRPARLGVALVGAGTRSRPSMTKTLCAAGHRVVAYASAGALTYQLRGQPSSIDLVIVDCGADSDSIVPALELLRAHDDSIAVVLISDGDPAVRADARRFSVDAVLERPVHRAALLAALASASSAAFDERGVAAWG